MTYILQFCFSLRYKKFKDIPKDFKNDNCSFTGYKAFYAHELLQKLNYLQSDFDPSCVRQLILPNENIRKIGKEIRKKLPSLYIGYHQRHFK